MRTEQDEDGRSWIIIDSLDEIPDFVSEAEEADWWATHDFSEALRATLVLPARPSWLPPARAPERPSPAGGGGRVSDTPA
jgi:hypothetical protein